MGFRFRKSIKVAPGIKLNISKGGVSTTVGKRGASVNVGKKGVHTNAGIPGTGLSYRAKISGGSPQQRKVSPVSFVAGLFQSIIVLLKLAFIIFVCYLVVKVFF
ncbi:DUF4236 domain-containing protein [Pseudomonas citronellolis]|uniref:DUF4236 domain-containing protein n=1 Tax=Pseudomonas citronellolis TaxID=53408 RepID=UPI0023E3FE85|nr:DUF4236 domain-containing protein [Pseudomonas citronellolis]MDF3936655.1 DUF4236 domain-containing protein [Pseudomonas citronellolis]